MYDFTMTVICTDWTVGKDVKGLTSNVRNEDIITHHIPVSPGVRLGSRSSKERLMVIE